jgi:hypothetical protein
MSEVEMRVLYMLHVVNHNLSPDYLEDFKEQSLEFSYVVLDSGF